MKKTYPKCLALIGIALASVSGAQAQAWEDLIAYMKSDTRPRTESYTEFGLDTATGAFNESVKMASIQGGTQELDLDIHYNTIFSLGHRGFGHGWTWKYNNVMALARGGIVNPQELRGWRQLARQVIVRLDADRHELVFNYDESLERYVPAGHYNKSDQLIVHTDGELEGHTTYIKPDGTTYLFRNGGYGELVAILNRRGDPIFIGAGPLRNTSMIKSNSKGIASANDGSPQYESGKPISSTIVLNAGPKDENNPNSQINSVDRSSIIQKVYRHIAYENGQLHRIYDPVRVFVNPIIEIDYGGAVVPDYTTQTFSLGSSINFPNDRLLRITADIDGGKAWLENTVTGARIEFGVYDKLIPFFTGGHLGSTNSDAWVLKVADLEKDLYDVVPLPNGSSAFVFRQTTATVNSIKIELALNTVGYRQYEYRPSVTIPNSKAMLMNKISVGYGGEAPQPLRTMRYDRYDRLTQVVYAPDPITGTGESYQEIEYGTVNGNRVTKVYNRASASWNRRNDFNTNPYRQWVHNNSYNLLSYSDAVGSTTLYEYDQYHRRTKITDPRGKVTQLSYNADNRVESIAWPNGGQCTFTYDELALKNTQPMPSKAELEAYALEVKEFPDDIPETGINLVYIGLEWVNVDKGEDDAKTYRLKHFTIFDGDGKIIVDRSYGFASDNGDAASRAALSALFAPAQSWFKTPSFQTDANRKIITDLLFDAMPDEIIPGNRGNLQSISATDGGVTNFYYDERDNLIATKDALGNEQLSLFNSDGKMATRINKEGNQVDYSYNEEGTLTSAEPMTGESKSPERIEYDSFGRVIALIDAADHRTEYTYDDRDNIILTQAGTSPPLESEYDYRNRLIRKKDTHYEYDIFDNLIKITDAAGSITRMEYDIEGRMIHSIDSLGNEAFFDYDAAHQLVQKVDALNNVTTYKYDKSGNTTDEFRNDRRLKSGYFDDMNFLYAAIDARGSRTFFSYDRLGRRTSVQNHDGLTTGFEYDLLGRHVKTIDPLQREFSQSYFDDNVVKEIKVGTSAGTTFTYTGTNNVKSITTPSGATTNIEYTVNDYVAAYTPPSGKTQQFFYDANNRLERTAFVSDSGGTPPPDIVYTYDEDGNNRQIGTQVPGQSFISQITKDHDALGRLVRFEDGNGEQFNFIYNAIGQVVSIYYSRNRFVVHYTYDAAKRLESTTDSDGRVTDYLWNEFNQLELIVFPNETTRVMDYDEFGTLQSRSDYAKDGSTIVSYIYTLDKQGKIVAEKTYPEPAPFFPPAKQFTYGPDNQLTQMNGVNITYDADGNITQGVIQGQPETLEWDYRNTLTKVGDTEYRYNLQDRLIGWKKGADEVSFAVIETADKPRIYQSYVDANNITDYVYGVGLAYEVANGEIKVHHYDERGSTVALSDANGAVSGRIQYAPYGEIVAESGADTLLKFSGLWGVITSPDNLYSMGFRWYSPEMGRFISMDSVYGNLEIPASLNRYLYGFGDPINLIDPGGEHPVVVVLVAVGVAVSVGAAAAVAAEALSAAIEGRAHKWENYLAAAIGGGVGGIVALSGCAVCAGAAGGLSDNLFKAYFNKESVDPKNLIFDTLGGAAGGYLGGKAGGKASGKFFGEITEGVAETANRTLKREVLSTLVALPIEYGNSQGFDQLGSLFDSDNSPNGPSREGSGLKDYSNSFRFMERALIEPTKGIGSGAEQAAYQLYLNALRQADMPLPNPPLNLSTF